MEFNSTQGASSTSRARYRPRASPTNHLHASAISALATTSPRGQRATSTPPTTWRPPRLSAGAPWAPPTLWTAAGAPRRTPAGAAVEHRARRTPGRPHETPFPPCLRPSDSLRGGEPMRGLDGPETGREAW